MHTSHLTLTGPPDFDFWTTVYSHGWCDLLPFEFDIDRRTLGRILTLPDRSSVSCVARGRGRRVAVTVMSQRPLSAAGRRSVAGQLRTCLRMDEDFQVFHTRARRLPAYRWIARSRSGRLLRAPTVFEDVVKMICTTNCTWALTKRMVEGLLQEFGTAHNRQYAFPPPEAIAGSTESHLRRHCTTGYRSPYILELSERVASGALEVESWRDPAVPEGELYSRMLSVKGVGEYAAENLLRLTGHYGRLGLDSWVRQRFAELHHRGRRVSDRTIVRHYREYGDWRGLIFWLEMTRYWHDEKFARKQPD